MSSLPRMNVNVSGANGPALRDPMREYVVGGSWGGFSLTGGFLFASVQDEVVRQFGPRIYELMTYDNAVATALFLLKAGALSDGVQLTPAVTLDQDGEADAETLARVELAEEVYEFCQRCVDGLGETIHETLWEMLDAMVFGCSLAEMVFELRDDGADEGKQVPVVFQVKPRWAWTFRVDMFMKTRAIRAWTADGWQDVETEHFTLLSWKTRDGDPRGSSILRPAANPFNLKLQAYPDYAEYLKKFASASLVLEAGPEMTNQHVTDPASGRTTVQTPQQQLLTAGLAYEQHSILALPKGAKATVIQSQGEGAAFDRAFDRTDREIFRAVVLAARSLAEAKHGSKADSESSLDVFSVAVGAVRKPLVGAFRRDFLRQCVRLNYGDEIAKELTPNVAFGLSDHIQPDILKAFSDAWAKGFFEPEQLPYLWGKLSVPVPPGWDPSRRQAPGQSPEPDGDEGGGGEGDGGGDGGAGGGQGKGKGGSDGGDDGEDQGDAGDGGGGD